MTSTPETARRVVQAARRHVWLEGPDGPERYRVKGGVGLVPGDLTWVEDDGAVSRRQNRTSELKRRAFRRDKVLAANVDDLVLVVAAKTKDGGDTILARGIAAAVGHDIQPLLVYNKVDLDDDGVLARRAGHMASLGFETFLVSATEGTGVEALAARLQGRIAVLVGASGVGKTALVHHLAPDVDLTVGGLDAEGRGRHTTTLGRAWAMGEGWLIDLPGVRSFGLVDDTGLAAAFPEVYDAGDDCRFRDCAHDQEPGCAVRDAVEAGDIPRGRLNAWREIRQSLDAGDEGAQRLV